MLKKDSCPICVRFTWTAGYRQDTTLDMDSNKTGIADIADRAGLKVYTENGRLKFEGAAGEIIKVWARVGADVDCTHDGEETKGWTATLGGEIVAFVLLNKPTGFSYSYTDMG